MTAAPAAQAASLSTSVCPRDPHTRLERAVSVSGKSKRQLVKDAVCGEVPGRQIAGEWRFSRDALLNWLGVDA